MGETPVAAATKAAVGDESSAERRKQTRVPLDIPVMMSIYQWQEAGSFSGQSVEGSLLDVSEDGVQIASKFPLEQDMFVVIHFLKKSELPPMTAKVIRIERKNGQFQYGCLLAGLPLYQRLQLKQYIDSHEG
nr:PilZ domain-containing protein [Cohnella panacarvi]